MNISENVLVKAQEKIGNIVSNIAQSHTLGMLETCEELALLTPERIAKLEVVLKLNIRRLPDGKIDATGSINYDFKKRVHDVLDSVNLIDPNPDLPGMEDCDIVDDAEVMAEEMETSEQHEDSPVGEEGPRLLNAAIAEEEEETETLEITALPSAEPPPEVLEGVPPFPPALEENFVVALTGSGDLLPSEVHKYLESVGGFGELDAEEVNRALSRKTARNKFVRKIKTALYGKGGKGGKGVKPEATAEESEESAPEVSETIAAAESPEAMPEQCQGRHPYAEKVSLPHGGRCQLSAGHEGSHRLSPEDVALLPKKDAK